MRPGGVTCGCPCEVADGVGRLPGVDVGALDGVEVGVELGDPPVAATGVAIAADVGALDMRPTRDGAGLPAGTSPVEIPVGSACRTGRSFAGGRAGLLSPGSDTPDTTLSPTAPMQATRTRVAPRSSIVVIRVRCPCSSAKT